jgi:hypothetical protein
MENGGWILLHRKSLNHWLYNENRPHTRREAWEDLLLLANHNDGKFLLGEDLINCERGQLIRSLESLAKYFNWTKSRVRRFLKLLENDHMIGTESLTKTTRITICNYEYYQNPRNADETKSERRRNADETTVIPKQRIKRMNKELKENTPPTPQGGIELKKNPSLKKEKEKNIAKGALDLSIVPKGFKPAVDLWLQYKSEKKQSYKKTGFKVFVDELIKDSGGNSTTVMDMIKTSIKNNWSGVFPLKNGARVKSPHLTGKLSEPTYL